MRTDAAVLIRRTEYRPPTYLVDSVDLAFELDPDATVVTATLSVRRNGGAADEPMVLNGEGLELVDLTIDGQQNQQYDVDEESLTIHSLPDTFQLQTTVRINPNKNTSLSGLYTSNGNFFTQCEAEGFRRITWFPDRPDVMSRYRVMIRANKSHCPILLSNGNLIDAGDCEDRPNWHWAQWEDPFPKPSYLFALVAGKLVCTEQTIQTESGKDRLLQVWVEPGNENKTDHAMQSLIRSIRWDEKRFGLELDLERFMIVAVSDFNMGAMENKGLNIFNTKYVFANPKIATDTDFMNVESVVGHEYFHNWTGNRVTCRDWFQLTLKEGLTVFRDQEFSADTLADQATTQAQKDSARVVKRIEDVRLLRIAQFAEDAGPMAHPIRPDTYSEINNFYTVTVYEKGAEVIRMLQSLVGRNGFRRGMDLYFQRHDGQAVTCDDFVSAIADANDREFSQFSRWYSQAGTPVVKMRDEFDQATGTYTLHFSQSCPPTPGQPQKQPFHIPIAVGLLDAKGNELALNTNAATGHTGTSNMLELTESKQSFQFSGLESRPVPSVLRGFSAPVILDARYSDENMAFLAEYDTDPFNRWEAMQRLAVNAVLGVLDGKSVGTHCARLASAMARTLKDESLDPAYQALMLALPAEGYICEQISLIDPVAVRQARTQVRAELAGQLRQPLQSAMEAHKQTGPYQAGALAAGKRAMKLLALSYLIFNEAPDIEQLLLNLATEGNNMTDQAGALGILVNSSAASKDDALLKFASQFRDEPLVMDKWFALQATMHRQASEQPVLERVKLLMQDPSYSKTNPNKIRSLIGAFCSGNLAEFHASDGSGYRFWLDQVRELDQLNPQVASRLARALDRWRKFDLPRQKLMQDALRDLSATDGLSRDVTEIVGKALADPVSR